MTNPSQSTPKPLNDAEKANLSQRLLTSALLLPVIVIIVLLGGFPFALLLTFVAIVGLIEFYSLPKNLPIRAVTLIGVIISLLIIVAFYIGNNELWIISLIAGTVLTLIYTYLKASNGVLALKRTAMTLFGVFYIAFPTGFLIHLRLDKNGLLWIVVILAITWGTDTFAYIGGRLWGKNPLAPKISPKKTVEGAIVGAIGGIIPALIFFALDQSLTTAGIVMVIFGPLVAIFGDLLESAIKRQFHVKDSQVGNFNLFPGHGGVLDRIDALICVSVYAYIFIMLFLIQHPIYR